MILKHLALVLVVLCCAEEILSRTSDSLKVTIDSGALVGRHITTHNGRPLRAFMGIPYAEPPVGNLRFKVEDICGFQINSQKTDLSQLSISNCLKPVPCDHSHTSLLQ